MERPIVYSLEVRGRCAELEEETTEECCQLHSIHTQPFGVFVVRIGLRFPRPHSADDKEHRAPSIRPAGPESEVPVGKSRRHLETSASDLLRAVEGGTNVNVVVFVAGGWDSACGDGAAAFAVVAGAPEDVDVGVFLVVWFFDPVALGVFDAEMHAYVGWVETITRPCCVYSLEVESSFHPVQDMMMIVVVIVLILGVDRSRYVLADVYIRCSFH